MASNTCLVNTSDVPVGTALNPLYVGTSAASGAGSATQTSVNSTTSSQTILVANTSRRGASVTNTDANALYLRLSASAATSTNYTVKLVTDAYYEIPGGYTGEITGIWAGDGSGAALVTELT